MIEISLVICLMYVVCSILKDDCNPALDDPFSSAVHGFTFTVALCILLALLGVVPLWIVSFFFFNP